jgi:hypothetical protein
MSKGSRIVPVRIPRELEVRILTAIERANHHTKEEPYTLSDWIRKCIEEKLAHLERSNRKKTPE